jgi:hypothetical protein
LFIFNGFFDSSGAIYFAQIFSKLAELDASRLSEFGFGRGSSLVNINWVDHYLSHELAAAPKL